MAGVLHDELDRLAALRAYGVLDTAGEPAFDDLAWLAAEFCSTPIAFISLVDEHRQWFKARVGLDIQETPRELSFCAHAIREDGVMVVEDATQDPRFATNSLVTGPMGIRFYAGAPLVTPEGLALGTVCAIDTRPRKLEERQRLALLALARQVVAQLERRRALTTERAQAARYRSVLDTAADGFVAVDPSGRIVEFNQAAETMFGWTREEALARDFATTLLPPDRQGPGQKILAELLAGSATGSAPVARTEVRGVRKGGEEFPMELSARVVAVGELVQVNAFLTDIGERKTAERVLEESRADLVDFLESAADLIQIANMDGDLIYVNAAWRETLGYSAEEAYRLSLWDLVPPAFHGNVTARREALLRGERVALVDGEILARDGSSIAIEGTALLQRRDGVPVAVRGVFRDVRARRAVEEARDEALRVLAEQNESLRLLDRMRDELVQLVSHELRTPLASILGYVELVRSGEAGPLTDEQERFLTIVDRNGHRLGDVVDDLLVLAQIDSGRLDITREAVDLAELARETAESFSARAADAGISLTVTATAQPTYPADRRRLGQVLDNLVSNAVKYTPHGGTVIVTVGCDGGSAVIEVADTGLGIAEAELPRLFSRFFRSAAVVSSSIPGTGLGLAITKELVEALGGEIAVESQLGAGTHFTVRFPL